MSLRMESGISHLVYPSWAPSRTIQPGHPPGSSIYMIYIDISTNHRLSWMCTLITDFTQNRPFSLKSPKIAPNHPKWPFWVIPRPTGRGITPYHTPFAPPAGPKVPNKGIGPSGPIRCNIGPQRGTKRHMNLGADGTQMATLPLNHSK